MNTNKQKIFNFIVENIGFSAIRGSYDPVSGFSKNNLSCDEKDKGCLGCQINSTCDREFHSHVAHFDPNDEYIQEHHPEILI